MATDSSGNRRSTRKNVRHPLIPYFIDGTNPNFKLEKNEIGIMIINGVPKLVIGDGVSTVDELEQFITINQKDHNVIIGESAPSDTSKMWFDTTNEMWKHYNGSDWVSVKAVWA